jgi:branched-chain amino acid transport system substrate-binding protein
MLFFRILKVPPVMYVLCLGGIIGLYSMRPALQSVLPMGTDGMMQNRRSLGAMTFSQANATEAEQAGVKAFKAKDYERAAQQFQAAIAASPTDPIPVIYHENAMAMQSDPLKIAVMVPLGSNREVSLEMLRGIALAQQAYNRGRQKVVIEIFNDENDPKLAKAIAEVIVKDLQIKAVVGPNASNAALAAAPILNAAGVVMITPTGFANELSGMGDYIFRTVPNVRHLADVLSDYSVNQIRRKKVAVCYDSTAPDNLSFKEEFINSLLDQGGTLIPTDCDFASPRFDAKDMVQQLISDGADVVLLTPHIDRLDRLIDLSRENQWRMTLLGSPSLETKKILEIGQGDLNGIVVPVPFHREMPMAASAVTAMQSQFRVAPTWRTFASMDALNALLSVGENTTERQAFQARLRSPNFRMVGATGELRFLPTGDRMGSGVLVQIRPASKGYYFNWLRPS